ALFPHSPGALSGMARHAGRDAILAEAAARFRGEVVGGTFAFGSHQVRVAEVAGDRAVGFHELFMAPGVARDLGVTTPKYLLVLPAPVVRIDAVERSLRALVPPPSPILVTLANRVPFDRDSPHTLPPSLEKPAMGEFAARMLPDGALQLDP